MSEEQKVDNFKLAGWKRAILIVVPFILFGLALFFMLEAVFAWGEDFTRNHGDAYLALALICTILSFAGIVMQFLWPKLINKGRRIVVVGLVFNIILFIGASIVTGVGYSINEAKYAVYQTEYEAMNKRIAKGLDLEDNKTDLIAADNVTVEQFIKDFRDYLNEYSGNRADKANKIGVNYKEYTTESFYQKFSHSSYAYMSPTASSYTIRGDEDVYNLYLGEEAKLEEFAKKYGFVDAKKALYGDDYKLQYAPRDFECDYSDGLHYAKAHYDYMNGFMTVDDVKITTSSSYITTESTNEAISILVDLNAKALRVVWSYQYTKITVNIS